MKALSKLSPCDYVACGRTTSIDIGTLVAQIATKKYSGDLTIKKNKEYTPAEQIMKFKNLEIHPNSKISFDIFNNHKYYVLVIDNLIVNDADSDNLVLTMQWLQSNLGDLIDSLEGPKGYDARPQTKVAAEGLPGGTGGRGGTRNSPEIFLFVNKISRNNSKLNNIKFDFSLQGIRGGRGGDGGKGGQGGKGKKGRNGSSRRWGLGCRRGKNGEQGGAPGRGGRGGNGGCGGNGPFLNVYFQKEDFDNIFERATYNVSGAEGNSNPEGDWGNPGEAGVPGIGGDGGSRYGNCSGGHRGRDGMPAIGSWQWKNHNLGRGQGSSFGYDGDYYYEQIENYLRVVFDDPETDNIN